LQSKIEALKNEINRKLPAEFPMSMLDKEYGWLTHPDSCQYNPYKTYSYKQSKYTLETYGHSEQAFDRDQFFSYQPENAKFP